MANPIPPCKIPSTFRPECNQGTAMIPQEFIAKWQRANLSERSAAQQHFLDLCDLLGQPKPAAADPDGAWYTFERGVKSTDDDQGWGGGWMEERVGGGYRGT